MARGKLVEQLAADEFRVSGGDGLAELVTIHPVDAHCRGPFMPTASVAVDLNNRRKPLLTIRAPAGPIPRLREPPVFAASSNESAIAFKEAMAADG